MIKNSINFIYFSLAKLKKDTIFATAIPNAKVAQLVERQPSKLNVASSNLVFRSKNKKLQAGVAQLVERILGRDEVTGSNPVVGSV